MTTSSPTSASIAAGSVSAEPTRHDHGPRRHDHAGHRLGHDHDHDHDHGAPGHAHLHEHRSRVPVRVAPSLIRASSVLRLAVAGLVSVLIWVGVLWACLPIAG